MANAAPVHQVKTRRATMPASVRPTAARRGYDHRWHKYRRRRIFRRDNYICQKCGDLCIEDAKRPDGQDDYSRRPCCDHIVAKPGGTEEESNLQTLCGACHNGKTAGEHRGGCLK